MFVQSNDWFYALDGLDLFGANGDPINGDVTGQITLYDAGTEADTPPGSGPDQKPAQSPTAVDVGPFENQAIRPARARHPQFAIPANKEVIQVEVEPIGAVSATTFDVTVANVSQAKTLRGTPRAGGAVPLSPGVLALHRGDNPVFTPGEPADPGTELIAEDGFTTGPLGTKGETLASEGELVRASVFSQPGGKLPALEPGESTTFSITATASERLSLETMFVQSNDWFYGLDGLDLFNASGEPISGDVTDRITLYDAGTEADTAPGTGPDQKPAQDPMAIDQGPVEDVPIQAARQRHSAFDIPANNQVLRVTVSPRR